MISNHATKIFMALKGIGFTQRTKTDHASAGILLAVLIRSDLFHFGNKALGNQIQSEPEYCGRR